MDGQSSSKRSSLNQGDSRRYDTLLALALEHEYWWSIHVFSALLQIKPCVFSHYPDCNALRFHLYIRALYSVLVRIWPSSINYFLSDADYNSYARISSPDSVLKMALAMMFLQRIFHNFTAIAQTCDGNSHNSNYTGWNRARESPKIGHIWGTDTSVTTVIDITFLS